MKGKKQAGKEGKLENDRRKQTRIEGGREGKKETINQNN